MAGIGIIANPHSKLNKRNPRRRHLLSYIAGEKGRFEITNNLSELKKVAEDFCRHDITLLAISGGDGTISRTLTAFIHAYQGKPLPTIALLRGGTMNMLADNLGIKGTPEQNLFRLLEAHASTSIEPQQLTLNSLRIGDDYGFLFASGTSARFLDEFYKNKTGALGVSQLVMKIACSALWGGGLFSKIVKSEKVLLTSEPSLSVACETLSIFCASVKKLPLGIALFPEATRHQDRFQTVGVTLKPLELIRRLIPSFLIHPDKPGHGKMSFCTSALRLQYESPQLYTLDGELYHSPSDTISIGLGPKVRFLVL